MSPTVNGQPSAGQTSAPQREVAPNMPPKPQPRPRPRPSKLQQVREVPAPATDAIPPQTVWAPQKPLMAVFNPPTWSGPDPTAWIKDEISKVLADVTLAEADVPVSDPDAVQAWANSRMAEVLAGANVVRADSPAPVFGEMEPLGAQIWAEVASDVWTRVDTAPAPRKPSPRPRKPRVTPIPVQKAGEPKAAS